MNGNSVLTRGLLGNLIITRGFGQQIEPIPERPIPIDFPSWAGGRPEKDKEKKEDVIVKVKGFILHIGLKNVIIKPWISEKDDENALMFLLSLLFSNKLKPKIKENEDDILALLNMISNFKEYKIDNEEDILNLLLSMENSIGEKKQKIIENEEEILSLLLNSI